MHPQRQDKLKPAEMTMGHLLGRSSEELANSVRACTELQWVISRLLEKKANIPTWSPKCMYYRTLIVCNKRSLTSPACWKPLRAKARS